MTHKIEGIQIRAFRGIDALDMDLNGKSIVILGDNGVGKSSFVQAIEFLFTGKVRHLEGVKSLSIRQHGPHTKHSIDDVSINISFCPAGETLTRSFSQAPNPSSALLQLFKSAEKGTFILYRIQLLSFIVSQPADRYRAIAAIIGIDSLEAIELAMMRVRDSIAGQLQQQRNALASEYDNMAIVLDCKVPDLNAIIPAFNKRLMKYGFKSVNTIDEADAEAEQRTKEIRNLSMLGAVDTIATLIQNLKMPLIREDIVGQIAELREHLEKVAATAKTGESAALELLQPGAALIESGKMTICPLCENPIDREAVLRRIIERLAVLRDLSQNASQARQLCAQIGPDLIAVLNRLNGISSILVKTNQFKDYIKLFQEATTEISELAAALVEAKSLRDDERLGNIGKVYEKIVSLTTGLNDRCKEFIRTMELTEEEKGILETVRIIQQVRDKEKTVKRLENEIKKNEVRLARAEAIYSSFCDSKKREIQKVYDAIKADIQKYYGILHPDEPHKDIELMIAPGRRASTELKIESFGRKGEDPRALSSEGHLDSLGLCIFLAFTKTFNKDCPIVVLDDVVTTVDSRHRDRIVRLLYEEFNDSQLIITTSDGIWNRQLHDSRDAYGMGGKLLSIEITSWDVDRGLVIRPYQGSWEKIEERLKRGDKAGAGKDAREYLEWILFKICCNYGASLPANERKEWMVNDLFGAVQGRIGRLLSEGTFKTGVEGAIKDLEKTVFMGNLLSHNNPLSDKLSFDEVNEFCQAVRNLYLAFSCDSCQKILEYDKTAKMLTCRTPRCDKRLQVNTRI